MTTPIERGMNNRAKEPNMSIARTAGLTVADTEKELAEVEATFKARRRTLRALIAAMKAEAGEPVEEPQPVETITE